jgi:hypothetical protein
MNDRTPRSFSDSPAERKSTPLLVGLFSPTGAGKTFSALRLATGIQRVVGGEIFGGDSESNRMLHYAPKAGEDVNPARGKFKFRHIPFSAPFSPDDYLDLVNYCVDKGAKTIIIDSTSHEHEGAGGVLEWHARETERLAKLWRVNESKAQMSAWQAPKEARRKLINRILQVNANFIFCFRAKEKLKIVPGKDPIEMGFMPIGGEELFFEMTVSCLLLPTNKGVPYWDSDRPGERVMTKLPIQFEQLFGQPKQLDEDTGEALARWAAGQDRPVTPPYDLEAALKAYESATTLPDFEALQKARSEVWRSIPKSAAKEKLAAAAEAAGKRIAAQQAEQPTESQADEPT